MAKKQESQEPTYPAWVDDTPRVKAHLARIETLKAEVAGLPERIEEIEKQIEDERIELKRTAMLQGVPLPVGRPPKLPVEQQADAMRALLESTRETLRAAEDVLPELRRRAVEQKTLSDNYVAAVEKANALVPAVLEAVQSAQAVERERQKAFDEAEGLRGKLIVCPNQPQLRYAEAVRFQKDEVHDLGGLLDLAANKVRDAVTGANNWNPLERHGHAARDWREQQRTEYAAALMAAEREHFDNPKLTHLREMVFMYQDSCPSIVDDPQSDVPTWQHWRQAITRYWDTVCVLSGIESRQESYPAQPTRPIPAAMLALKKK